MNGADSKEGNQRTWDWVDIQCEKNLDYPCLGQLYGWCYTIGVNDWMKKWSREQWLQCEAFTLDFRTTSRAPHAAPVVKNPPASAGDIRDVGSVPQSGRSLEEGMATHSSILSWRIPWTEEPGGLQSMGLQRFGHNWSDLARTDEDIQ